MNILAIHTSHHGSISISKNNQLIVHHQLERFNNFKYQALPSIELFNKINQLDIIFDVILISFLKHNNCFEVWKNINFLKYLPIHKKTKVFINHEHHLFHASCALSFDNSKQDILIWDGNGKQVNYNNFTGDEIYTHFNKKLIILNQQLYNPALQKEVLINNFLFSPVPGIGESYSTLSKNIFDDDGLSLYDKDLFPEGKVMALSSYGKIEENNKIKLTKLSSDINDTISQNNIYRFQKECEKISLDLLKKFNVNNNLMISGGVCQNILINTFLSKYYDIEVDPICNDQGISLGLLNYYLNFKLERPKHCYLGFLPNYDLNIFNKEFIIEPCNVKEAADIVHTEPLALFQGRSEQGQRALGNRSLLMNPTHKNCLDLINTIKKREWYRPFACSILHEHLNDYFIVDNNRNPEYMMFVFNRKENKKEILKNVSAVDGTCRLQSVKQSINPNYYNLLKTYNDIYQIPFLLNTSLNMPGKVIVETLQDLKEMMLNTNLNYCYLPEKKVLIKKLKI